MLALNGDARAAGRALAQDSPPVHCYFGGVQAAAAESELLIIVAGK
jgi:hypothetical protein